MQLGKQLIRYLRGLLPLRLGDVYVERGAGEFALEPPLFVFRKVSDKRFIPLLASA
jgi:hypothetical protein